MCTSDIRTEFSLSAADSSGRSCCGPDARAQTLAPVEGLDYLIEGLTCGHCVQTVENAVRAVDGVESATVELVAGGVSRLTVAGTVALTAVRDAVIRAGYSLASTS
ncbi:heavy-metal-associated domain-containing protein [Arthrobacter sp. U41]|uniref:heavy-metal-associated domain-containing protein n=1 Tax=Arthrobacter sp. U41 TaxID=1849032 RepID=UPI0008596C0D|nr:cation transporter [Arthrobacter sp. U41]AOT04674.1 hypothetical protein ASPU41_16485 [Arthrobacter sp. U41]